MKELLTAHMIGLMLGTALDWLVGDPAFLPHPVRAMGNLIAFLERELFEKDVQRGNRDIEKEKRRGMLLWVVVVMASVAVPLLLIVISYLINRYLGIFAEAVLTCYILAARSLSAESLKVFRDMEKKDLPAARCSLSMIVGRDTESLSEEEIAKAAIETVAENTSDGVIAPFLYTALGGPVLGMAYKAVNTMDSMLGYRNERYEYFGRFSAIADDIFNYIPSRASALLMILGSFILGAFSGNYSGKRAFKIWKRDRYNHTSPNAAQTESACAGALGLRLGGTHLYRGIPVEKPTIGDETRKPQPEDIKRAGRLMYITEILAAGIVFVILLLIRFSIFEGC